MNEMKSAPAEDDSPVKLHSFRRVAGSIFVGYCVINLFVIELLLAHAVPDPIYVLLCLSFVGPPALAFVMLALWYGTARPNRSVTVLGLFLAGAAVLGVLNFLCFVHAVRSV
jgi:hypothetical protein